MREHAEHELLGDGRQEAAEEDEGPGEAGIEEVAVRDIGGRPGAVLRGDDVERGLVRDEDAGEGDAEHGAEEEALGAEAAALEEMAERDLAREHLAVERLGARR